MECLEVTGSETVIQSPAKLVSARALCRGDPIQAPKAQHVPSGVQRSGGQSTVRCRCLGHLVAVGIDGRACPVRGMTTGTWMSTGTDWLCSKHGAIKVMLLFCLAALLPSGADCLSC
ncbi:hypothetical protein M8818_005520 [Zalaria obscura]|uniref:Uncharacterized protein n=1 Tax=Zalaria obscura TaxID=2024903 RepID=A0ACC3SA11_9PEZI